MAFVLRTAARRAATAAAAATAAPRRLASTAATAQTTPRSHWAAMAAAAAVGATAVATAAANYAAADAAAHCEANPVEPAAATKTPHAARGNAPHAVPRTPASESGLPVLPATLTFAPAVPPPLKRRHPAIVQVDMNTTVEKQPLSSTQKYEFWTFNGHTPGPFIRARVGDVLNITYTNHDASGMAHNIDFHAVTGPGGGAPALFVEEGQTRSAYFKLLYPGLFFYHCAAEPLASHIANGMYGLMLVEPEEGLPPVDREYYVLQSEFYTEPSVSGERGFVDFSYLQGLSEDPTHVVFNGRVGALTESPLRATQGERVRIYFGNAGPNLVSSFHVIGTIFDKVYREGDLISPPARGVQTTLVPAGGTTVVELDVPVPGNYTLVDHSIFRVDKGAVGFLKVAGEDERRDIFESRAPLAFCPGCKLHN